MNISETENFSISVLNDVVLKPTTMSILNVNVRSLKKHLNDLEAFIHSLESPPNLICLTETWLTDNDDIDSLLVPGYNIYAVKNRNTHGGGVTIQIQDSMSLLETHSTEMEETLLVSLQYKKYRFELATVYNPPRTNKLKFVEKLDNFLNDLTSLNCPTVITGDFNIDTHLKNQLQSNYLCTISSNDFELANLETTRETSNSSTCVHHFIYQNFASPEFSVLTHENFADHYPILMKWPINIDTHLKNQLQSNYLCTISSNDFELANLETTRETSNSSTCLHHFLYQNFASPEFSVLTHENFADHYPILMKWPNNVDTEQNYLPFRDISFIKDQKKLSNYLTDLDWSLSNRCHFLEFYGTNELFTKINNLFLETTNKYAPLKCLADKKSKVPKWFTNSLKNLRFKKIKQIVA